MGSSSEEATAESTADASASDFVKGRYTTRLEKFSEKRVGLVCSKKNGIFVLSVLYITV